MKRPAIVDLNNHFAAIIKVGNFHIGRQRQAFVRSSGQVHIVWLATGGAPAMKFTAIPGCYAAFMVTLAGGQNGIGLTQYGIGGVVAITGQGLILGYRFMYISCRNFAA